MLCRYAKLSVLATVLLSLAGSVVAGDVPGFDYGYAFQSPNKSQVRKRSVARSRLRKLKFTQLQIEQREGLAYQRGENSFARDGRAYYVYGGYVFSYHFNDKTAHVWDFPTIATQISVNTKTALPDMFHGYEIGIGKEWGKHLDIQIAYLQQFERTKNATITRISSNPHVSQTSVAKTEKKGFGINFLCIFNPDDQIQAGASLGIVVTHISDTLIANTLHYRLPDDNITEIDPAFGLAFVFQVTPKVAFRVNGQYVWHTVNKVSSGEVNSLFGLSYTI